MIAPARSPSSLDCDRKRATSSPWRQAIALIACAIVLLIGGGGCRRSPTTGSEPIARSSASEQPPSSHPPESDDERSSPHVPEGFPTDVPIYPGATVLLSRRTAAQLTVTLVTNEALPHVLTFYRERLPQEGWRVRERETAEGASILEGQKGTRACRVTVTEDHAHTYIALALSLDREEKE